MRWVTAEYSGFRLERAARAAQPFRIALGIDMKKGSCQGRCISRLNPVFEYAGDHQERAARAAQRPGDRRCHQGSNAYQNFHVNEIDRLGLSNVTRNTNRQRQALTGIGMPLVNLSARFGCFLRGERGGNRTEVGCAF